MPHAAPRTPPPATSSAERAGARREPLPEPRLAGLRATVVYALCTLALAYPALGGKFLANPHSDEYIAGFAFREYGAEMLAAAGGFPLWNPYLFGGMPFVAAMHGDIFYPTFLLRALMPTDVAMTLTFVIHTFLAGLFTYFFLRAWGLGFWASLAGGVAYLLSGPIASYASPGHDGKLYVSALLPLVLWMLLRGIRDARLWAWGVLAIAVGLAVLSPHPQLLQYMLLTAGAWALYVAFSKEANGGDALPTRTAITRLGYALVAVAVGMLMGAIQYVPVMEYVDWSPRAGGKGWEHAVSFSFPPEELINTILPQFSGILDDYWGRNAIHFHSEYLGVVVLLLVGIAFLARRTSFTWFWTGVGIVTLLWALGGYTPFYRIVYAIVPGTKFFRAPSMIIYVVAFSVAVLAALGLRNALEGAVRRGYLIGWGVAGALLLLLAMGGAFANLGIGLVGIERAELVLQNQPNVVAGAWRTVAFLAAGIVVLALMGRGALTGRAAAAGLVALAAVDLWTIERRYWIFMPEAEVIYASDPAIDVVKAQEQPGRVIAIPLAPPPARDPFLMGDALMSHDVRQIMGYHGNELGRYQWLYGKDLPDALQVQRWLLNPNFRQLTNARWLYTNADPATINQLVGYLAQGAPPELVSEIASQFQLAAGPARNAAGTTVYLYRLPGENPYAWVTPLRVELPDSAVLNTVLDPRFDVRRAALFDTATAVPTQPIPPQLPEPLAIETRVVTYEPGHVVIELSQPAPEGATLVVSENYYPGWTATVDGREVPVGRADLTLIGVALPAGARRVELTFRSEPYYTGKMITLGALAASLVLVVAGIVLQRRRAG